MRILPDENAPAAGLHSVENRGRRGSGGRRSVLPELPRPLHRERLQVGVRYLRHVAAARSQARPQLRDLLGAHDIALGPIVDLAGIVGDRRADVPRHDDRAFDVRRMHAEIADQGLGKALHGELRRAIRGMRRTRPERCPEPVHAADVDDVARVRVHQHRQEGPRAEIDAAPADVEGSFPLGPAVGEQAAAAGDAGVIEEQVHPVGGVLACHLVAEAQDLRFIGDIGDVGGNACALPLLSTEPLRLGHGLRGDIAHGDIAALGNQLARQFAAHAGAATGNDRKPAGKILHVVPLAVSERSLLRHGGDHSPRAAAMEQRFQLQPPDAPSMSTGVAKQILIVGAEANAGNLDCDPQSRCGERHCDPNPCRGEPANERG